jgi:rhodanese-related sulfurtransferase
MNNFINFLVAHWILSTMFLVLLSFYIIVEVLYSHKDNKISPQLAVALLNHQHAIVLDLRPQAAFEAGHIIDAIHFPAAQATENYKKIQKFQKKPVIIVGEAKPEIAKVMKKLQELDFQQICQLIGGMQEWVASGLPTTGSKGKNLAKGITN